MSECLLQTTDGDGENCVFNASSSLSTSSLVPFSCRSYQKLAFPLSRRGISAAACWSFRPLNATYRLKYRVHSVTSSSPFPENCRGEPIPSVDDDSCILPYRLRVGRSATVRSAAPVLLVAGRARCSRWSKFAVVFFISTVAPPCYIPV